MKQWEGEFTDKFVGDNPREDFMVFQPVTQFFFVLKYHMIKMNV